MPALHVKWRHCDIILELMLLQTVVY